MADYRVGYEMNIAIVEDNNSDADMLIMLLSRYKEQRSLALSFVRYSCGEAFLASSCEEYQLIFMDIYLGETDGIETARRLAEQNTDSLIVFLTTSREDIWRAVKVHACFDYIEKNKLDYRRIEEILDAARKKLRLQTRMVEFYNGKQKVSLSPSKIQYLISDNKYTSIMLENGREMRCRITFSSLLDLLEEDTRFLLCNRGILLNMDFIRQADREIFVMADGKTFPIRKRDNISIMQRFNDHQFKKLNEQEGDLWTI